MGLVLHIGYDPALIEARGKVLSDAGFAVITARNNVEAQSACHEYTFAAVVLGYASPLPNRKVMLQWLREHCPGVPVVALYSGNFMPVPTADYSLDADANHGTLVRVLHRITGT